MHLGSGRVPQVRQVTLVIQDQGELLEILSEDPQEQLEHKAFLDQMHQDHGIQGLEAYLAHQEEMVNLVYKDLLDQEVHLVPLVSLVLQVLLEKLVF